MENPKKYMLIIYTTTHLLSYLIYHLIIISHTLYIYIIYILSSLLKIYLLIICSSFSKNNL